MHFISAIFICSSLVTSGLSETEPPPLFESFEDGVPAGFRSSGGKVNVTGEQTQEGGKSLRWDFKAGDSVTFETGPLGNVGVWTGYGGYSRSAFVLPIHLASQGEGKLVVEIRAGERTAATIDVPLAHRGWQKLVYHYSWNSGMHWLDGKLRGKLDNIRITATGVRRPGHAYFDAIHFNTPRDFRDARAAIAQSWEPVEHDFSGQAEPEKAELAKVEILAKSMIPAPNAGASREHWQKRMANYGKQIKRDGLHRGKSLTKAVHTYFGLLNSMADDWCRCPDPELRKGFAAHFNTVNDWIQEQGLVVNGAFGKMNNYVGRLYVDAITKMRDPLQEHGTLADSLAFLKWSYHYDDQLFGDSHHESMDYFHNEATRLLRIALAHGNPIVRHHHVAVFRKTLGKQLLASITPDGCLFHHGFHYFAYGSMGVNSISGTLAQMSHAGLPVSREGLDTLKNALMQMRWYSGGTTLWSLSGRNSAGTQGLPAGAFLKLAKARAPYLDGSPDPELAAAFLRLRPEQAGKPEFDGITAEASPTGFNTMPFAALAMHRRDDWLAGIKGYSKYAAAGESYANQNRFGVFLSHGQLELLTHPMPFPTVHGSGTRPDHGYNWAAIEGATTVHAPLEKLANGNGTRIPRSAETFVGGLSNGDNGMFSMVLNDGFTRQITGDKQAAPLRALKSWFCFDKRIVCVGSNISTAKVGYPVRTNLFQKFLAGDFATTVANGEKLVLAEAGQARTFGLARITLVDPYGNAYLIPAGNAVQLTVGSQASRDPNDQKDSTGNYATAWIEHGSNPENAAYTYLVLVQPEPGETAAAEADAPYTLIRSDAAAHIVRDHPSNTVGYALFNTKDLTLPTDLPLQSASHPCLVMIREYDDHSLVSATIPDTRPGESEPQTLSLTIRGHANPINFQITHAESRTQVVEK